jgi:hypothetical protein
MTTRLLHTVKSRRSEPVLLWLWAAFTEQLELCCKAQAEVKFKVKVCWCDGCCWLSWWKETARGDDETPEDKEDDSDGTVTVAKEASSMVWGLRWFVMAKKDVSAHVMESSEILQEFTVITKVGFTETS